jgi:hypothetical protein
VRASHLTFIRLCGTLAVCKFIDAQLQGIEAVEWSFCHAGLLQMQRLMRRYRVGVDQARAAMPEQDEVLDTSNFTRGSITRENLGAAFEPVCVIIQQVEAQRARLLPIKTHLLAMKAVIQTHITLLQVAVQQEADNHSDHIDSAYE